MSDSSDKMECELTAEIVSSFLRNNKLPSDQVAPLISTVHKAIVGLGKPMPENNEPGEPAVPIRRSVTPNSVVCLECGWRGKTLGRHLSSRHDLTRDLYRVRWRLSPQHPLTAPAYSEQRSALAKQLGLGRRSKSVPPSSGRRPK